MTEINSISVRGVNLPQSLGTSQAGSADGNGGLLFGDDLIGGTEDTYTSDTVKEQIKTQAQELIKLAKRMNAGSSDGSEGSEGSSALKKSLNTKLKALKEQAEAAGIDLNALFSEISEETNMSRKDQKLISKTLKVKISKKTDASSESSSSAMAQQSNPFGTSSKNPLFAGFVGLNRSIRAIDGTSDFDSGSHYSGKLIGSSSDASLSLSKYQDNELSRIKGIYQQNKSKYDKVSEATGVPAELICAIHYRESGCNFGTYLHNGDPLGQPTTHVPKGKNFSDWSAAAIDAINSQRHSDVSRDNVDSQLDYAERYNGLGYRRKGVASPYVWAGTSNYSGGMYVRDGVYSASAVDKRVGVAAILQTLYT